MLKPISVQLYTVRGLCEKDFFGVLKQIADIGFVGVEYAGLHGKSAAEVATRIKELGLKSSSAHVGMPTPENIAQLKADAGALGYTRLVTGFGPKDMESEEGCKAVAA